MVDNLLPEHVELPHLLDLAVRRVHHIDGMGWVEGVILRLFSFQHFFPRALETCFKLQGYSRDIQNSSLHTSENININAKLQNT